MYSAFYRFYNVWKLIQQTESIADSVYNLNWTTKDYKLRSDIHLIIMRAQKEFYCTAYGFFPIGHQKLTAVKITDKNCIVFIILNQIMNLIFRS